MKIQPLLSVVLTIVCLSLTACGGPGEAAYKAVQAQEADPTYTSMDMPRIAAAYRDVAARYPDVADRALAGAQRAEARYASGLAAQKHVEDILSSQSSNY